MALVADQDDRVAVLGELARLDVDLGHQRAGRVDRAQARAWRRSRERSGRRRGRRRRPSRPRAPRSPARRRSRRASRARCDDVLVVDDLLAHVDRRAVQVERVLDRLHGAIDARAVAARRREQDPLRGPSMVSREEDDTSAQGYPMPHGARVSRAMRPGHMDRLTSIDASFLTNESSDEPHARGRRADLRGAAARLRRLPRARRAAGCTWSRASARSSPSRRSRPAGPFWVDDPNFNLAYHVRHSALPVARLRGAAAEHRRPPLLAGARPLEAALGDLAGPGPGEEPLRADQQDPPRAGRRRLRGRHRDRPLRPEAGPRADRAGPRLGARARRPPRPSWPPQGVAELAAGPVQARPARRQRGAGTRCATARKVAEAGRGARRGRLELRQPGARACRSTSRSAPTAASPGRAPSLDDFKRIKDALGGTVNDVVLDRGQRRAAQLAARPRDPDRGAGAAGAGPGLDPRRGRARPARQPDRGDARAAARLRRGPGQAAGGRRARRWTS